MRGCPPRLSHALLFASFGALLVACGGGGGGGGGGTSSTPSVPATSAPASYSTSISLSTGSSTTVSLPGISSGISGSITLPAASAAATGNLTFGSTLPSGVAPLSVATLKRNAESIGGSNITLLAVVAMTVNSTVTVASFPGFSFTVSSGISGDAYVAYFDANNSAAGWNVILGPGTVAGSTVTFPAQSITPAITFQPNDTYVFALFVSSTPATTATLSYSGTKTTTYAASFAYSYPTTPPTPTPTSIAAAATVAVSVGASPYPAAAPTPGLLNLHVAESDAASLSTTTYTTDTWVALSSPTTPYVSNLYGSVQQEPSSNTLPVLTTLYVTPQTTDKFPQTSGTMWSNSPAASITYSYSDGDSGTRAVAADGSYSDTENLLGGSGGQAILTENADGSGSMSGPFLSGGAILNVQFSASSNSTCNSVPSGTSVSPPCVTSTINFNAGYASYFGLPNPLTAPDATWYSLPLALYAETDSITASAALPGSCTPNSYGTTANDVRRSMTTVDTVIGFVETTILDSYELGGQPICLVSSDTQNYAYDEQQNTPSFLVVGSLGLETITTTESLILQSGAATVQSRRIESGGEAPPNPIAAALQAHELQRLAHDRAVRTRNFIRAMRTSGGAR